MAAKIADRRSRFDGPDANRGVGRRCMHWGAGAALALASCAVADVTENTIGFIDRGARNEIVLGPLAGGIAVLDYDGDGWLDLVVGENAGQTKRLFRNIEDPQNPGGRTFADVTAQSGIDDADGTNRIAGGVVTADYDNDGDHDIYMTGRASNPSTFGLLYRNDGGVFTNVSVPAGLRATGTGTESASWSDYDLDGDLDLLLAFTTAPYIRLFDNNGDGTFMEASQRLPAVRGWSHSYANAWLDYDLDGWPDCFLLSNAGSGTDALLRNVDDGAGGRRFENVAEAVGFTQLGPAPMGIAFGDYDGDLDFDIGISDAAVGTYFRNDGGVFTHISPFQTMFGWGVDWLDADNDGWLEFYTAGSWGSPNFDNLQRNLGDGTFQNISPQLNGVSARSRYSVQVDYHNDGRVDLITVVPDEFVSVYENLSENENNWVMLRLTGDGRWVNRDAVGAVVRLTAGGRTQIRQIANGTSTTATEDLRLHFGLGQATTVDEVEIVWPRLGNLASRTEFFAGPLAVNEIHGLVPQRVAGDLNCDGAINFADVNAFVLALSDPAGYEAMYPDCNLLNGDVNFDGQVNFADINPFVALLSE